MANKKQCPRYSKIFASKQSLQSHFQSQTNCHMKDLELVCPFCQKKFSRKFYLKKHIENMKKVNSKTIKANHRFQ
jgi:uncharacterized protein VirK/YbjX